MIYGLIVVLAALTACALAYGWRERRRYRDLSRMVHQMAMPGGAAVAEIKPREPTLSQTQKLEALGQLAGGVAHDFNNVLAIIDGYVHMALKSLPQGHDQLALYLERIDLASKRGAALTSQLLLFGRQGISGDEVLDVAALVREQESLLYPLLDSSIALDIHADEGLRVECARDGLAQILMNLVINARDAMPDGGRIVIEVSACDPASLPEIVPAARQGEEFVMLGVADTGVGIDPETITRIFDPFFTTKEKGRGTGLGLSMVYGLVQDMRGFVDVSTVMGEGTTMRILLPRTKEETPEPAARSSKIETLRFDGYTALVAEDEPDLLNLVCLMLEERGMEVLPAASGAEALARQDVYEGDIDFLITDVVMPGLNGVKLAELVQAARAETCVVFMSGFPAGGRLSRINVPEEAVLLTKPVTFEQLAAALQARLAEDGPVA